MVLQIPDKWVWDFWFAQDGLDYHIFYLQASRKLKEEKLRHWHASIGHAISQDLINWEILPDALSPSVEENAWDNYTTWTGSVIHHAGSWYMFYTGTNRAEGGKIQRIGLAISTDLTNWHKHSDNPIIQADPQWYETLDSAMWDDQAWRDPWVFYHNGIFHAYITARIKTGHKLSRGVIGHARSTDLLNWKVSSPVTEPGEFGYLEVPQLVEINGRWYLFFSALHVLYSKTRRSRPGMNLMTGTHYYVADRPLGPFEFLTNEFLVGDKIGSLYSGKVIRNPEGEWVYMAFRGNGPDNRFIGDLIDPLPVTIAQDGKISLCLQLKADN